MSNNKTLDKILDDIIEKAAITAAENLGKNMPEPEKVEFSKEHEEKMRKIFKKERNKLFFKKISKYSKRVAIFFLALAVVSGVTIFSVEAWRIKVMNFIIEMNQTHSEIKFSEEITKGNSYKSNEITLGYIPEGFELERRDVSAGGIDLIFTGKENYFVFSMDDINSKMGIDTENASVKKMTVNGREAFYSSNDNVNILVWHDEESSYTLSGKIEEKEIFRIAENIKK
jgi:hypothetical protein